MMGPLENFVELFVQRISVIKLLSVILVGVRKNSCSMCLVMKKQESKGEFFFKKIVPEFYISTKLSPMYRN